MAWPQMPFKYTSSFPLYEQGNVLKENKNSLAYSTIFQFKKQESHQICGKFHKTKQKKGLYFKYQCLFWSSFGTMQDDV